MLGTDSSSDADTQAPEQPGSKSYQKSVELPKVLQAKWYSSENINLTKLKVTEVSGGFDDKFFLNQGKVWIKIRQWNPG